MTTEALITQDLVFHYLVTSPQVGRPRSTLGRASDPPDQRWRWACHPAHGVGDLSPWTSAN